jgi:uncharacterized protein YkwD
MSRAVRADNSDMQSLGGRSTRRCLALAVALALLLGACSDDGSEVTSDERDRGTVVDNRATDRARDRTTDRERGERRSVWRTAATTSTTTTTTTTTAPPPTEAPTTTEAPATTAAAPPPPPPTTAPPPPPPPPTTAPPPPPPPPSGPAHGTRNTGCEQYMYNQINAARANAGRGALQFDTGIQHVAVNWSDEMARTQTLRHNPNYGNQILQYRNYRTAGENVGRGYEQGSLFQAFMNSPGHRANIESGAYSHVTVGCLTDGGGQLWITQNFWGG